MYLFTKQPPPHLMDTSGQLHITIYLVYLLFHGSFLTHPCVFKNQFLNVFYTDQLFVCDECCLLTTARTKFRKENKVI